MFNLEEFVANQNDVPEEFQEAINENFMKMYEPIQTDNDLLDMDLGYVEQYITEEAMAESYGAAEYARRSLLNDWYQRRINLLITSLKPENNIERAIINDRDFIKGAFYGKPRPGHPEGVVHLHIREVLDNVDKFSDSANREKLRFVAFIHDTFKYACDQDKPKSGENHHAMIARRFAERYTSDTEILDIIELHDEAYNSWLKGSRDGKWDKAMERAKKLVNRLGGEHLNLFMVFYRCDNLTGNKKQDNYFWFEELLNGI